MITNISEPTVCIVAVSSFRISVVREISAPGDKIMCETFDITS